MILVGLRLTLRSGKEGLVRLAVTAAAVAVGVALLLGVLAEFHAFEANAYQQCWSCTQGSSVPAVLPSHGELWNDSVDYYQGQTIERLDVAALGPGAPVPPGISHLPAAGQYYASPALAAQLRTLPADELGARFPGHLAGTIGQPALAGTNDLVIYIGYSPSAVSKVAGTTWVTSIFTGAGQQVFTSFFKDAFYVGVLAVLLPMLVLISTATRLAADRREERFAALRLVGGTPADIRVAAAADAVLGAFAGAAGGTVIFLLIRPALAGAALLGTPYFESGLTPTLAGYLAMLAGVPLAAAVAAVISLRQVQISPLGVTRRATPKPPSFWRLVPLALGIAAFAYGLSVTSHNTIGGPAYPGLLLTMIGLVIAGPWLTWQSARVFGAITAGSSALLAARRLSDNPRAAFRSVSGLVLAVFLGTMVGTLGPAVNAIQSPSTSAALSNILVGQVGVPATAGQRIIHGLEAIPGATVYPLYQLEAPGAASSGNGNGGAVSGGKAGPGPGSVSVGPASAAKESRGAGNQVAVGCSSMRAIAALGECAPGVVAVQTADDSLFIDNPTDQTAQIVGATTEPYTGSLTTLPLQAVLVRTTSPAALERARTYLAVNAPPQTGDGSGDSPTPPRTFGETLAIRSDRADLFEQVTYAAVALTLVVAGCGLAVAVGGGLVERKRPFTLLRVSGTPVSALIGVVLLEAAVPLVLATVIAGAIAYGASVLAFVRLAPAKSGIPLLGHDYYALMAIGLAAAFGIICVTLPLLRRMTAPGAVRFE
jgi:hypothetical protein